MVQTADYCDFVDSFRQRAGLTRSGPERRRLEELTDCLESSGCGRAELLGPLADLQDRLNGCETRGTRGICNEFLASVDEVLDACRAGGPAPAG